MRARRLAAVATVALGLVALSGCRAEPGVAAYVGGQRITELQVADVIKDLRTKNPTPSAEPSASGQPAAPQPTLPEAADVVRTMVLTKVCERLSAEKNYQPRGQATADQAAQQLGLNPETGYAREVAKLLTCMSGLPTEPVEPTAQEMADVIAAGRASGKIQPQVTDEQAAGQLNGEQLQGALATKHLLNDAAERYDVTVNPRYRPLEFPLLSFTEDTAAVSIPLGGAGSGTVTDVSTPDASPSSPNPNAEGTAS
ncbi:hypothetical protein [Micromonospora sp. NPDC005979]|uniref:hypothetical protein n=1 Tax=Micromonospora sp. NPDC005979 TaxID=3156726 RepID=UPI0033B89EAD